MCCYNEVGWQPPLCPHPLSKLFHHRWQSVGQALTIGKSMLALPSHFVVFHGHANSFHEGPFCSLFRDWLEADWSVVSHIFSLGQGHIFTLLQSISISESPWPDQPDLHDLSKMKQSDFAVLPANPLSTLRPIPPGTIDLHMSNMYRQFLTLRFTPWFTLCFVVASWHWDLGANFTLEPQGTEKVQYLSLFCIIFNEPISSY